MSVFSFRQFQVQQKYTSLKVGTDAMLLGAFIDVAENEKALDIGAGTGVLSLMIAQKSSRISITAIEVDTDAILDLKTNFKRSPWSDRLRSIQNDFLKEDFSGHTYDLIFSNPPFYENGLLSENEKKNKSRHELSLPLESLFSKVNQLLTYSGSFWIILPYVNHEKWISFAHSLNLYCCNKIYLYAKPDVCKRVILTFQKVEKVDFTESNFLIRNQEGNYSEEYKMLTKDYHSKQL